MLFYKKNNQNIIFSDSDLALLARTAAKYLAKYKLYFSYSKACLTDLLFLNNKISSSILIS